MRVVHRHTYSDRVSQFCRGLKTERIEQADTAVAVAEHQPKDFKLVAFYGMKSL